MPYCHTKANISLAWLLERTHVANSREGVTLIRVTVTETLVTRPEELTDLHPIITRLTFLKIEKQKNKLYVTYWWNERLVRTQNRDPIWRSKNIPLKIPHTTHSAEWTTKSRTTDPSIMTSFVEKHCRSSLSSRLIVDTALISKLFSTFVPICSQLRLYICYLGEFVKNKNHWFQCFSANDFISKGFIIT